ncbi:hypothetical protein EAF04_009340 [Stromatinia cepivora]|nr:hypothetical protein EAF04_009340 [Stromatinia cepivora]
MASSEPILQSGNIGLDSVPGSAGVPHSPTAPHSPTIPGPARVSGPTNVPRPVKTKVPGPATQLLNDFFAEIDEIDTSESIDASYVNVLLPGYRHARERAGPRPRSRLRVETSFDINSPNVPDQPPTSPSPTHSLNQPFSYSRPHVNSEEDLQQLASRFQEIHTRNSELINEDAKSISNSLPNPKRRNFSNSSKAYDKEFGDVLKKEKEIFESSPSFIANQMPGITGSQMQKQIPKLFISDAVLDDDEEEEDEEEKNAIEILEALFSQLGNRENGSSEDEWKSAEEIIEGAKNKGRDTGKGTAVATEDIEDIGIEMGYRADMSHGHDIDESREINFFNQEAETEVRQYSSLTQQYIENGSSTKKLDSLIEKGEEDQAHLQSRTSDEFEVAPFSEFGDKGEEKWTQSHQDLGKDFSVRESQKIDDNNNVQQGQHDSDGSTNQVEGSNTPSIYHDTADDQNVTVDSTSKSTTSTSNSSTTSSTSTSSTNDNTEERRDPQFEMAALATGVMIASLWMIERKIRPS